MLQGWGGRDWRPLIFASSAGLRSIRGVSLVPNHRAPNPAQPSRARRSCLGCETRPRALSHALALSRPVGVMAPLYRHFPPSCPSLESKQRAWQKRTEVPVSSDDVPLSGAFSWTFAVPVWNFRLLSLRKCPHLEVNQPAIMQYTIRTTDRGS